MRIQPLAVVAILATALPAAAASNIAPIQEVEVVGSGSTKSENKAAAMARAEENAIRQAVEKVSEMLIGHDAVVSGYPTLKDHILNKPRRYLKEYRITSRVDKGATAIVQMSCQIQADFLARDLEAVGLMGAPRTGLPKVVVLPDPRGEPGWWVEGGKAGAPAPITGHLVDALKRRGFQVVEPKPPAHPLAPKAQVAEVRKFAAAQKADVFLAVRWNVEMATQPMDGLSYVAARARLTTVNALSARDGSKVASAQTEAVVGKALLPGDELTEQQKKEMASDALRQAADTAATRLAEAMGAKGGQPAQIQLVVAGLGSFAEYVRFQQVMASQLSSVQGVELGGMERGEVAFRITLGKSAEAFADELGTRDLEDFQLQVTERKPDRVVVHVQR